jgi:hypothetical protein
MVGTEHTIDALPMWDERSVCRRHGRFVSLAKLVFYPRSQTKRKLLRR